MPNQHMLKIMMLLPMTLMGCSSAWKSTPIYIEPKGYYNKARQYGEWSDRNVDRLSVYIGRSESEILTDFGEPSYVNQDAWLREVKYSHSWVYHYSRGIFMINQNTWICIFYFEGDKVVKVHVM